MTSWPQPLQKVLDLALQGQNTASPLHAIFDLDSTLFDVSPRITEILRQWALLPGIQKRYPTEAKAIAKLTPHASDWGVRRTLERVGLAPPDEEFKRLIVEHWKTHFFANHYLTHDVPYAGAVEFVHELYERGAHIYYLTGRDVPRMWQGTVASLKQWKFPLDADHANLILKPGAEVSDSEFKKQFFMKTEYKSDQVWFFENEPTNIALVDEFAPHIKIIFVDTVHSGHGPPPAAHIARVAGFKV